MDRLFLLAIVVQVLTEGVSRIYAKFTVYVALVLGLAVAFIANVGLLETLEQPVTAHYPDVFLAGLLLAGGAGLVQEIKQRISP